MGLSPGYRMNIFIHVLVCPESEYVQLFTDENEARLALKNSHCSFHHFLETRKVVEVNV